MSDGPPAVQASHISKRFGRVAALHDVSLEIEAGRIQGLLGENGAGKSTLMNILFGLVAPDAGTLHVAGELHAPRGPADARAAGIGMVHQHFMLVDSLTVAENLALHRIQDSGSYDRLSAVETARELGERYQLPIRPEARAGDLSVGERQWVEIVKALDAGARLLILDEPTAVLTPGESERLFLALRGLAEGGRAILFISHRLSEIFELCSHVTVLRNGSVQDHLAVKETDSSHLTRLMVGREPEPRRRVPALQDGTDAMAIQALTVARDDGGPGVEAVSLELRSGTITAVAGIEGNGQEELCEGLAGLRSPSSGRVTLAGLDVTDLSPLERSRLGLGFIPGDRQRQGIAGSMTLTENLSLRAHRRPSLGLGPFIRPEALQQRARDLMERHDIRPGDPELPASSLSGGNQQKLVAARELDEQPGVLLALNPTRGLDVGAMDNLHDALLEARSQGAAILLVSTDLDEVLALGDSILVLFRGKLSAVPDSARSRKSIGLMMGGETPEESRA